MGDLKVYRDCSVPDIDDTQIEDDVSRDYQQAAFTLVPVITK